MLSNPTSILEEQEIGVAFICGLSDFLYIYTLKRRKFELLYFCFNIKIITKLIRFVFIHNLLDKAQENRKNTIL